MTPTLTLARMSRTELGLHLHTVSRQLVLAEFSTIHSAELSDAVHETRRALEEASRRLLSLAGAPLDPDVTHHVAETYTGPRSSLLTSPPLDEELGRPARHDDSDELRGSSLTSYTEDEY